MVVSRLVGSTARGAVFDASRRAASRPELGLAALTPRLFAAFILSSAAAAAWDRRVSAVCGWRCLSALARPAEPVDGCEGEARVCPPERCDGLEQIVPISLFLSDEKPGGAPWSCGGRFINILILTDPCTASARYRDPVKRLIPHGSCCSCSCCSRGSISCTLNLVQ